MRNSDGRFDEWMNVALQEAKLSLREGNNGFGAVIVKNNRIVASAHDGEETESNPTSHAELNAIRIASQKAGKQLDGCVLISTHEPCPMCAAAIVWSGMKTLVYGYSIAETLAEGRKRVNLTCEAMFARAGADIDVQKGVLHDQCSVLYRKDVRNEIKKLRNATHEDLNKLRSDLFYKRTEWYGQNKERLNLDPDPLIGGYELLLKKLGIEPEDAPIVEKTDTQVVFHSKNFCPTLEACNILGLDTRYVCREVNEEPTDALVKQLSDKLEFGRNYEKLRPYCDYCEEMISLKIFG